MIRIRDDIRKELDYLRATQIFVSTSIPKTQTQAKTSIQISIPLSTSHVSTWTNPRPNTTSQNVTSVAYIRSISPRGVGPSNSKSNPSMSFILIGFNVSFGPQIVPTQGQYFQHNTNMGNVFQPPFLEKSIGVGNYVLNTQGIFQTGPQVQGSVPPYGGGQYIPISQAPYVQKNIPQNQRGYQNFGGGDVTGRRLLQMDTYRKLYFGGINGFPNQVPN